MAIAVPSSSVVDLTTSSTSVTITKPTGLAVGDMMVAILARASATVPNTLSGWTLIQGQDSSSVDSGGNRCTLYSYYKIADSGDTAASNFTFTASDSVRFGGGILRITGHGAIVPNKAQSGIADAVSPSIADTVTPSYASSLIIFPLVATNTGGSRSTSSYAIATSNPSWTELWDTDSGGLVITFACAYAIRPEVTATGNSTVTYSGGTPDTIAQLIVVPPVVDTTISPASVQSAVASVPAPSVQVGITLTASVASATASVQSTTEKIELPWTPQTKGASSTWTTLPKHL